MDPNSDNEQQQFAQLRAGYINTLPAKKQAIETALAAAKNQQWSHTALHELKTLAHRLAGSGGGYGLPQLSEAGRALEQKIILQLQADSGAHTEDIEREYLKLSGLMDQLFVQEQA